MKLHGYNNRNNVPNSLGNNANSSQQTRNRTSGSTARPTPRPCAWTEAAEGRVATAAKEDGGACARSCSEAREDVKSLRFQIFLEDSPGKDERISMSTCWVSGLWLNILPSFQK